LANIQHNQNTCININDNTDIKNNRNYGNDNSGYVSKRSIDSLKVRIPLEKVKLINPLLIGDYTIVQNSTGLVLDDDDFKQNAPCFNQNGVKTYYKVEKQVTKNQTVESYCVILLSSKVLGSRYFEGIQNSTLYDVHQSLQNQNFVNFSLNDFAEGEITDVDVKYDFVSNEKATDFVTTLYNGAKMVKKAVHGCSIYKKDDNCGIQFALRKTDCFKKAPYLKFYEKVRELNFKSTIFNESYLKGKVQLPEELMRCETTIKNKKHLTLLGADGNTLGYAIDNIDSISENAFRYAFRQHINISNIETSLLSKKCGKLNSYEKSLGLNLINLIKYENYKLNEAIIYLSEFLAEDKNQKYKIKQKLIGIGNMLDIDTAKDNRFKSDFYAFVKF
jgi:hypothetical protein